MFISSASRGIGLPIVKRVAADGANVALMAKTSEPQPKLPGTIYAAAEETEAAGGQELPIVGAVHLAGTFGPRTRSGRATRTMCRHPEGEGTTITASSANIDRNNARSRRSTPAA